SQIRKNEIDFIGTTVLVGNTYYNSQHNGTIGRMIGMYPGEMTVEDVTFNHAVSIAWMDKPSPNENVHVRFNRAWENDLGEFVVEETGGYAVDAQPIAAYVTLGMDDETGFSYPTYHGGRNDASMHSLVPYELFQIFPGVFAEQRVPDVENYQQLWPRVVFSPATEYLHIITTENPVGDSVRTQPQNIYYSRHQRGEDGSFTIQDQVLITDLGRNISGDIAVSDNGERVAIGQTISRIYLDPNATPADWTQYNQDLYVWISEDGGETWDFENPLNLTDFIPPDLSLIGQDQDSTLACKDTLRAYADCNVYFDHNDILHVAFTATGFFEVRGTIYGRHSMIYHWDEESDVFTMISDGVHDHLTYDPGVWQRSRQRPNMYQDPLSGMLYCVFNGYGWNSIVNPQDSTDESRDNMANAEVYISVSPPTSPWYGRLWSKEFNLTNTVWHGNQGAGEGDCRSECDPSISLNNDGDYLNIFYILDYYAGNARQNEGTYTLNDAIWNRISKRELLDAIDEQGRNDPNNVGWVENYPLHIDRLQHWIDTTYSYAWENDAWLNPLTRTDESVDEKDILNPEDFSLEQNFPNPFNPVTHIAFNLERAGYVRLVVYDVLGREIAQLVDRKMSIGSYTVNFDATTFASGIYFVKLSSGSNARAIKMVLMK
ncbi:T9SS type A sorting domain-containing protein, partial [Calditrichota bacterium]